MKSSVIAAIFAVLTTSAANASTVYDFSYTFSSPDVTSSAVDTVTGSFTADLTGIYFNNVSNIQVNINGTPFTASSLVATAWNTSTGQYDSTISPVISTVAADNNFGFADVNLADSSLTPASVFTYVNDASNLAAQSWTGSSLITAFDTTNSASPYVFDNPANTSWTVSAAVPVPGSLGLMVSGLCLLAAAGRRRLSA